MFPEIDSLVQTDSSSKSSSNSSTSSSSSRTQSYISTSYFKNSDALREFITKFPEGSAAAISVEGGVTWLTHFAYYGEVDYVEVIVGSPHYCKALLDRAERHKEKLQTPLQWAIERGHWDVVEILLPPGPKMNITTYLQILKHYSSNEKIIKLLYACQVTPSTSYIISSEVSDAAVLRAFMARFPEGPAAAAISVEGGVTWLTTFAFYGKVACVKAILESLYYCEKLLNSAEQYKEKLHTPLQFAVEERYWEVVELLLEYNPQMDLETYKKIIQYNKSEIIERCHATQDGTRHFEQIKKEEVEQRLKATKILQTHVRGVLMYQEINAAIADINNDTAVSPLGKMLQVKDKNAVTQYILRCRHATFKKQLLTIIFTQYEHPLSQLFFPQKDSTQLTSYDPQSNLTKLYQDYRGAMLVNNISSTAQAQQLGILPPKVSLHGIYQQDSGSAVLSEEDHDPLENLAENIIEDYADDIQMYRNS